MEDGHGTRGRDKEHWEALALAPLAFQCNWHLPCSACLASCVPVDQVWAEETGIPFRPCCLKASGSGTEWTWDSLACGMCVLVQ